ncbi:Na+/H+ antiporter NhaC family protein [Candidatus Soleaferrea massiliensis]|uniref:Na+/H+ antiporter NhaC family protein n=1 Tax=Candidatus Soleaferrea massiliensis TaxID=1470354 RepID=UPI0006941CDD|nr:Na+/H+ antiporter NhaC family protein [Candidatus Soleaferrea massiliensis]
MAESTSAWLTALPWLSLLPPIIAIVLALITKEVISSLLIGVLSGAFIFSDGNPIKMVVNVFEIMSTKMGENAYIILFLALLGVLVILITMAGGSNAYGEWAARKIKTRAGAQLATSVLGCLIFIDDYFNCLTIGTVMRPVTDKHRISRAKLAYIIDATAAPICIIAPISSWALAVTSIMSSSGVSATSTMDAFMNTIPYNLYAFLTIFMVVIMSVTNLEFGPMAKFEKNAIEKGDLHSSSGDVQSQEEFDNMEISKKGRVFDLVIPILALIIFAILSMLYLGDFFTDAYAGEPFINQLMSAFGNTNSGQALVIAAFGALLVAFFLFVPRKLMSFRKFMDAIPQGVKSMVSAIIILCLAWSISGICSADYLQTGNYVGQLVHDANVPLQFIPAVIFVVACLLAFATGTSWGTFGILIPIVVPVLGSSAFLYPALGATLAGAVFGDHISPISDTTILSSTGARCNHIDHVSTQLVYTIPVAICCVIGYILDIFIGNAWITLAISLALLALTLFILHRVSVKKTAEA